MYKQLVYIVYIWATSESIFEEQIWNLGSYLTSNKRYVYDVYMYMCQYFK